MVAISGLKAIRATARHFISLCLVQGKAITKIQGEKIMTTAKILLTGATGNTGQPIVQELRRRGISFAVMSHSKAKLAEFKAQGIETVYGDFDLPDTLELALTGIEKAYLVCTPDEKLVPRETAFIAAARKTGVKQIVMCSAYMAAENAESQNLRSHGVIEKALRDSGIAYTIIKPIGFMQTFTLFVWDTLQKAGAISMPAGDGGMPLVDVRDVAQVAVKALTEPGHEGKVYEVTGPENLTMYRQAEIMEQVLQRRVVYIPSTEKDTLMIMSVLGVPETPTEHVIKVFRLQREHRLEKVHTTLQELGIQPTSYEQFLRDYIAGRTSGGNSFQQPDTLFVKAFNAFGVFVMRMRVRQLQRAH
jgi:uncharacterized protein YbjT (DUF2867 family)